DGGGQGGGAGQRQDHGETPVGAGNGADRPQRPTTERPQRPTADPGNGAEVDGNVVELPYPRGLGLAGAPTGRRVRARLARFNAPWQTPQVSEDLEPLIASHRVSHPKADVRLL